MNHMNTSIVSDIDRTFSSDAPLRSPITAVDSDDYDESHDPLPDDSKEHMRCLLRRAYFYLNPSRFFRFVVYVFAERKMIVLFWVHFICTMIVWVHFFMIKFDQQKEATLVGAPFYWWKRLVPPLEFGLKHIILFQMALIPLTMSRYSIAALSGTVLQCYVPLNRMVNIHIYLGTVLIMFVSVAAIGFVTFFGVLCHGGQQAFCDKLTSEIMITGYVITGLLMTVAITSFLRHIIPYKHFYVIHHLVFVLYGLTVVHTLDGTQRSGTQQRSQTFKWFSLTILYYVCDRLAMHFHHNYETTMASFRKMHGDLAKGERVILLRLQRPPLFRFQPGQYAFLQLDMIDHQWHPFSIASGPTAPVLEFYIQIMAKGSWSDRLGTILSSKVHESIKFRVMGPYGTSLARTQDFSHTIAFGTGTGIVPILSLFQKQVRQLMRLDPDAHFADLKEYRERVQHVEVALESRKRSVAQQLVSFCQRKPEPKGWILGGRQRGSSRTEKLRKSIECSLTLHEKYKTSLSEKEIRSTLKEFRLAAMQTTSSIYGVVLLGLMPVVGVALIGFTISFNTIQINLPDACFELLQAATVLFQIAYSTIAVFIWNSNDFFTYTDIALCLVAPFADWYWLLQYKSQSVLSPADVTTFCLLAFYMTARAWTLTIKPHSMKSWRQGLDQDNELRTMERLDVVWVTRSAALVSEILPDMNATWQELVASWGLENAKAVCRLNVYVTDKDVAACESLARVMAGTLLDQNGFVHFGRPDIDKIIEDHSIEMICTRRSSSSLFAYVGSTALAKEIHESKLFNDMKVTITGNKKHQMEFVSESYGGVKSRWSRRRAETKAATSSVDEESSMASDTVRKLAEIGSPLNQDSLNITPGAASGRSSSWKMLRAGTPNGDTVTF